MLVVCHSGISMYLRLISRYIIIIIIIIIINVILIYSPAYIYVLQFRYGRYMSKHYGCNKAIAEFGFEFLNDPICI